jgi:hypothetical protein
MRYPREIVTAAWTGIAAVTSRYVNGTHPFDGFVDAVAKEADDLVRSDARAQSGQGG